MAQLTAEQWLSWGAVFSNMIPEVQRIMVRPQLVGFITYIGIQGGFVVATKLINHLKRKTELDIALQPLAGQWFFDQELVKKALNNINVFYPHYSIHDASHSDQILVNIERIIGDETISMLSASDTWLILEAAYWHDIGMVLPMNALKSEWKSAEFESYLAGLRNDSKHELHNFITTYFKDEKVNLRDVGLDVLENIRYLISDYYRARHGSESANIVEVPWERIGLQSPRNSLIPKRLFALLGQICASHNWDFTRVMDLPQHAVGLV